MWRRLERVSCERTERSAGLLAGLFCRWERDILEADRFPDLAL